MSPRDTSVEAWKVINETGALGKMQTRVYNYLFEVGPATGKEINRALNTDSAHKRLSELKKRGVITEVGKKTCSVTGRNAYAWDVTSQLPSDLDEEKEPNFCLTIEGFDDHFVVTNKANGASTTYDKCLINQVAGHSTSVGGRHVYNGRNATQIRLWSGMPDFSMDPGDLND